MIVVDLVRYVGKIHRDHEEAGSGTSLSTMTTENGEAGQGQHTDGTDAADAADALTARLRRDMVGALELLTVYLGERLGLYRALAAGGPATSTELAGRTGTVERYVREWLEHHAVSGLLEVDDVAAGPLARRYRLPPAYAAVLADPDDIRYRAFNGVEIARAARQLPDLAEAFRTGGAPPALPWAPEGRADYNRAVYLNQLGRWLPTIADVDRRLRDQPPARVADLACGPGWSSIAMAQAYPLISVDGFDLDPDVIEAARRNAAQAGVSGRVTFAATDAAAAEGTGGPDGNGRYDLVTIFEALHDMARPVDVLRAARDLLTPSGSVIIADELVADEFTAPAPELERYHYGWSVVGCLPGAMDDPHTAATGAVMRPATLRRYAEQAGFSSAETLPLDTENWRFYQLRCLTRKSRAADEDVSNPLT
jgi:2-polyprenyl-3-methyl-5-hydroxy-6-metoxy-1,4-benzoquinol methylase